MKKAIWVLIVILSLEVYAQSSSPSKTAAVQLKPKLVVAIVLDQFRYDYLLRFKKEYNAGLHRLLTKGAVFANARYDHFPLFTSVGHAALLTGAYPSINGIIGNQWYDRESRKVVGSASDNSVTTVGSIGRTGSSPRNLKVSTLGDEIKIADSQAKVFGISIKDYAAILSTGHMANGVYWFDTGTGNFVTSSYYVSELPAWVKEFNAKKPADRYKGMDWLGNKMPSSSDAKLYGSILSSPFGSELIEELAEKAIESEQLGRDSISDLLMLSFSSNDYVGHRYGPDSPQVRDMCLKTDKLLEKLFRFLDARIGLSNVTVMLAADHGVAPLPEVNAERKMPGGRLPFSSIREAAQQGLTAKFGEGKWIESVSEDNDIYLNWDLIKSKKLTKEEVAQEAATIIHAIPHVFRAYTREQLMNGMSIQDQVGRRLLHSYSPQRGPDLYVLLDPYYIPNTTQATHGTAFGYDTHVPLIFMGPRIKAGDYYSTVVINDVAPTLSAILGIETPSGAEGRILSEMFIAP
jgi:predicted AlkP superfamily pyrophosphatase or phosphodiesterase